MPNPIRFKRLFFVLFFCCLGITTEVFFTAFSALLSGKTTDYSLTGHTYVWMVFIYALIPFLFDYGYNMVKQFPWFLRWVCYALFIYFIEFTGGFLLESILGQCPWEYTEGWHVFGWIRLDYFPFWFLFGGILEYLYLYLAQAFKSNHHA